MNSSLHQVVHQVDVQNFHIESQSFLYAARRCRSPLVFLDTEFPGNIYRSNENPNMLSHADRYSLLKRNADAMRPIQVGITLSDGVSFTGTWQFDLCDFDILYHPHVPESIALLESAGIDLERHSEVGIHSISVAQLLFDADLVGPCSTATWVAFHGCYDFAIMLKALIQLTKRTPVTLPETVDDFMVVTRCLFGFSIYDVKCVMKSCKGLYGGLDRVASKLEVERVAGKSHQAGSDSLLTCQVFLRMKKLFFSHGNDGREEENVPFEGVIFGVNG